MKGSVRVSSVRGRFSNTASIGLCCHTPSIGEGQDFDLSMAIETVRVLAVGWAFSFLRGIDGGLSERAAVVGNLFLSTTG